MPFNVNNTTVVTDDRIVQSVSGPVGSRPGTPTVGMMFFNTTDSIMEVYNGTTWVSSTTGGTATPNAWAWGRNIYGSLGDNTTVNKSSPVSVVGGFTDWTNISAGINHTLGIRANGTLYAWGNNSFGALGDNTTVSKSSPVLVAGGFTDWIDISGGFHVSLGIRANGTLWSWGFNTYGELGDNTTVSKSSPVAVVGGFTDWVSASAGFLHSLGIRTTGQLYAWGRNTYGELGDNTTVSKSSPVLVAGGFTDWKSVSASHGTTGQGGFTLGIRATGQLYAWGRNAYGQLGDNTTVSKRSPVLVTGGFTDWINANASPNHSLGVRANGTLYAWGNNLYGALGDNTTVSKSSPVPVVGGFTDWVSADTIRFHSVGLRANGTIWSWGQGTYGRLGNNSIANRSSPVAVVGGFTDWVQVSCSGLAVVGVRAT